MAGWEKSGLIALDHEKEMKIENFAGQSDAITLQRKGVKKAFPKRQSHSSGTRRIRHVP
jgi:hypothetical protein